MRHPVNSIYLNVREQGQGSLTLLFMHYFGGSSMEWQRVMNQLADRYHCVALDLRGHGHSDAPGTGYSVDDMADDVEELVSTMGIGPYVLVGHSMSGKVALAVAARQPASLRQLILVSPSPPCPEPIPDDERQKLLTGHGQRASAEKTLKNITEIAVSGDASEQIITDDLRTAQPAWDAWLQHGSNEDITDRMRHIAVPVAIIVGSEDRALPPDVQETMVKPYLPQATITRCDGAGHLLPWEIPDQLAAFIAKKVTE
ncbi:pimeloyl-ACP methyl ester carboxylesterase [Spirosoma lacussanchae]|uniref:alpha/beta fold hydrolase n=1 Tax=Spirosoma lacussanchae TaxID=1884249 RepID=UPI001107BA9A|nr:alpha/beta hydrolase [Spirosoma lacussanchae]